jgi:hypothetical protein
MKKEQLFVEQRPDKTYAVRRGGSARASIVCDTQREAIIRAKAMTDGPVVAERVRDTKVGGRDQWRKT